MRHKRLVGRSDTIALGLVTVALLVAIVIVNPNRELLTEDDGWAYARSVLSLLQTGRYELDQWSAANMPVQIYLAGVLSKVFGYSLSLLRWSTLLLFTILVLSFYGLLRLLGVRAFDAGLLTLGLMGSPLLLMLSFTFMSDIHFLGWLFLSLCLYARGVQTGSRLSLALGSLAAAMAIGTRQFGIAIIFGWLVTWASARREARPEWKTMALALALPVLAAIIQIMIGLSEPNITQAYRLHEQRVFLSHTAPELAREMLWRVAISLQFLAILLLPVSPVAIALAMRARMPKSSAILPTTITFTVLAFVVFGLWLGSEMTVQPPIVQGALPWPALGLIWMLQNALRNHSWALMLLDFGALCALLPLIWLAVTNLHRLRALRSIGSETALCGWTATGLMLLQLPYVQLNDTYVVGFVPFALLALGVCLRDELLSKRWKALGIALSALALLATSLATAKSFNRQQAVWEKAERLASSGIPYAKIAGPRHWAEYHGAFDDWIEAGAPGLRAPPATLEKGQDPLHDPFYEWLAQRNSRAVVWTTKAKPT